MALSLLSEARAKESKDQLPARPVIVELFTSQGCALCLQANFMLAELKRKRKDVLALSLHVDYWDYLGWEDSFASKEQNVRQRSYVNNLKLKGMFTPQTIVDGRFEVTGARRIEAQELIDKARRDIIDINIDVAMNTRSKQLEIKLVPTESYHDLAILDVWMLGYDEKVKTLVTSGENKGRTLVEDNVVKKINLLGKWSYDKQKTFFMKLSQLDGAERMAIIVQEQNYGRIRGAISK